MLIQTVVINKITTFSGHSFFEFQLSSYHMNFTFTLNNTYELNKLIWVCFYPHFSSLEFSNNN